MPRWGKRIRLLLREASAGFALDHIEADAALGYGFYCCSREKFVALPLPYGLIWSELYWTSQELANLINFYAERPIWR